jgi:hypothetical protein
MLPLAVVHRQPATYELSAFRRDKQYLRAGKLHQMMIWQANSELTGIRFRASPMLATDDFCFAMQNTQAFRMVRERTIQNIIQTDHFARVAGCGMEYWFL